jgi:hypothetical protein
MRVFQLQVCIASDGRVADECLIEKDLERSDRRPKEALTMDFSGGGRKNHNKLQ